MEFLAEKPAPCSASEISAGISSPRSTTYLLLDQLVARGYLGKSDAGRYFLGHSAAMLGNAAMLNFDLPRVLRGLVQKLAFDANQLSEFVGLDGWKQIVLIAASPKRPSYLLSEEGRRHPLPRTASSRFLLRDFPNEQILAGIPPEDYVLRDGSIMRPNDFIASIESTRGADLFSLHGQVDPHLVCIASPITNAKEQCVATISIVMPIVDMAGHVETLSNKLREAAAEVTRHMSLRAVDHHGVLGLLLQNKSF